MTGHGFSKLTLCHILLAQIGTLLGRAAPADVAFSQSAPTVEAYDFVEVTLQVSRPDAPNPFTDVTVQGRFGKSPGAEPVSVTGFCDASDGSVYRIRFMPAAPGEYAYDVTYRQEALEKTHHGSFKATASHRRGSIRVDPQYRWHFVWEGTGEHYFFNGTTAFWLMGWREDRVINQCIERLHGLKINRLRVLLAGAANILWGEPVMTGENFSLFLRPWMAKAPGSYDHPGNDYTRFNSSYWQKWERMLRFARDRDMIISVILDISTHSAQPAAGSDDEHRYIRYAAARLSAFSNITWDLGDDLDSYRDEKWAHETGRIIPQTNEEYGYEDHYPHWAPKPDGDSAETLRRIAWEIAMAGAYGTAGESARRGVNIWPDLGGGWINGRGDDTMVMLKGYEHLVDFFTSFDWWKTEPHDELVNPGAYCLAKPGEIYAVYLPREGTVTVTLEPSTYQASWFNAFTGEVVPLPPVQGPTWTSPQSPGWLDWALLLLKQPSNQPARSEPGGRRARVSDD